MWGWRGLGPGHPRDCRILIRPPGPSHWPGVSHCVSSSLIGLWWPGRPLIGGQDPAPPDTNHHPAAVLITAAGASASVPVTSPSPCHQEGSGTFQSRWHPDPASGMMTASRCHSMSLCPVSPRSCVTHNVASARAWDPGDIKQWMSREQSAESGHTSEHFNSRRRGVRAVVTMGCSQCTLGGGAADTRGCDTESVKSHKLLSPAINRYNAWWFLITG